MSDDLHRFELIPPRQPYKAPGESVDDVIKQRLLVGGRQAGKSFSIAWTTRVMKLAEFPKVSAREAQYKRNIRRAVNRGNRRRQRYWQRQWKRRFGPWTIVLGPPSRHLIIQNFSDDEPTPAETPDTSARPGSPGSPTP